MLRPPDETRVARSGCPFDAFLSGVINQKCEWSERAGGAVIKRGDTKSRIVVAVPGLVPHHVAPRALFESSLLHYPCAHHSTDTQHSQQRHTEERTPHPVPPLSVRLAIHLYSSVHSFIHPAVQFTSCLSVRGFLRVWKIRFPIAFSKFFVWSGIFEIFINFKKRKHLN